MSDRLLSGRGQYLSKAAKVGYKEFYMCGFEGIGERRTPVGRDADGSSFQLLDLGNEVRTTFWRRRCAISLTGKTAAGLR